MPARSINRDCMSLLGADIQRLPSILARIVYLAQTRDPNTGMYSHRAVDADLQAEEVHRTLEKWHIQAFRRWLQLNLESQKVDFELYLAGLTCDTRIVVTTWINLESYRSYIPSAAVVAERDLFFSTMGVLLRLLSAQVHDPPSATQANLKRSELLTVADVSSWLRVPQRTLRLWAEIGAIPGLKLGRQWRFCREVIEKWINARSNSDQE